jgi:hypothetical protein
MVETIKLSVEVTETTGVYHTNSLVSIAFFAMALSFGVLFVFNLIRAIKAWKVRKNAQAAMQ